MIFQSRIQTTGEVFESNRKSNLELLQTLQKHLEASRFAGKDRHIDKARTQGKLLARERIELVLDPGSFFLEIMPLIGLGGKGFGPGGTTICGVGLVYGRLCMIAANVGTHKGGAIDHATLQKSLRASQIAMDHHLPTISLVESSGANLPEQEKIFNFGGAMFRDLTRRSRSGIPTIAVVFGNSTAGGAYVPGMSDYSIFVENNAKVFLAGPPLVKQATGEVVDDESLGGARMHGEVSGVADFVATDERDGIRIARELISKLAPPNRHFTPEHNVKKPRFDTDQLLGIISADVKQPYDARELIARVVDDSDFLQFKPQWGSTLVTCYADICGYPVGILANNGVLLSDSANKGAHFIQLCNRENIPLVFFQNITGFMVGEKYERDGIIKHGAKLINAVANSDVPSITIMAGSSYGAGNYAMNGLAYEPSFLFSYPNSKIAVMGSEQLSGVMQTIQMQAAQKSGADIDPKVAEQMRQVMIAKVEEKSNAWYATGQGWDDGVIDPRQTRDYLGICLAICNNKPIEGTRDFGIFRM